MDAARSASHASVPKYIVNTKYLLCRGRRAKRLSRVHSTQKQKEDVYEKADNHGRRKTEDQRDGLHPQKIGYIWDYYKLWIIGAVVLVGLVVYFTVVFATREDKPILDVVLVNNYDDVSEDCRLTQGFVSYVGEENLPGRVTFDNNAFFNLANNSDYKNSYYMKVLAYLEADTAQAVLCQYDNLIGLAKSGRLADLSDEKVGDIYDKYKDRIIYYEDEEGKKIPVGIDVSEGYKAAGLTEYTDGKAYIGLSAYAADYGYVEKFVDYMVELGIQSGGAGCR